MTVTAEQVLRTNIKKFRTAKKLTQEELSEMAGISRDYLSEIERGLRFPGMKRLDMIAIALGVDTYKLLKP